MMRDLGILFSVVMAATAVTFVLFNVVFREQPAPRSGAVPVLANPVTIEGVETYYYHPTFRSGTSTVVSIKSPAATSTALMSCKQSSGLTFAQEYELAIGSTMNATTTNVLGNPSLGKMFVPASGAAEVYATTTSTVVPPSSYLNVKMATTSGTTVATGLAPVGSCSIVLRVI